MGFEEKWQANQQKVDFLRSFPGLRTNWEQVTGSTIEQVIPIPRTSDDHVLLLSQGAFAVTPPIHHEPQVLTAGLVSARPYLESFHASAFQEYDRLNAVDQEAGRQARLSNILSAIENNLERIPELKIHLRKLVEEWEQKEQPKP